MLPPPAFSAAIAALMGVDYDTPPPPPPTIQDISGAVTAIVAQALSKDDASKAAARFSLANGWVYTAQDQVRTAFKQNKPRVGGSDPESWLDRFEDQVQDWLNPNEDLRAQVEMMRGEPQTAMWIIPSLLLGISAYLQIWRWNDLLSEQYDMTVNTVINYKSEVDQCHDALLATSKAWTDHVNGILTSESLQGTPEGDQLAARLTQVVAGVDEVGPKSGLAQGTPDTTPIGKAVADLKQASDDLEKDITAMKAGGPSTLYWKQEWGNDTNPPKLPRRKHTATAAPGTTP